MRSSRARGSAAGPDARLRADPSDVGLLVRGEHHDPHCVLGLHPAPGGGALVRAFHPDAVAVEIDLAPDLFVPMARIDRGGLFAAWLARWPQRYLLRFRFADRATWERDDPYRFPPTLGDLDLHLFTEGTHRRLGERFGARVRRHQGVDGVAFSVWAPGAKRVSVVGDFCAWDGRLFPMRSLGSSGVFELFIPGLARGDLYKFEILTAAGELRLKSDPFAQAMEQPPATASRVWETRHVWEDGAWMARRPRRQAWREPLAIYETHLGSWARVPEEGDRTLSYREIAPRLADHVRSLGFTHLELMPIAEYPFSGSWGYQVSGYYAPTSRFGTPDDFRAFVDICHQRGLGVILDWVPAHFPKDDFALRRFDGTALFEHEDPRRGEHPDWGTLIFNYGRHEVRAFLVANALWWLNEFHLDGLRVDAVASMLYLDYSRPAGEWLPNERGGRENLDAIDFLRQLNAAVEEEAPGCFTVAEESTAWPGVTAPIGRGGLGFTFKWNMGWMHDTLDYLRREPVHRSHHHDQLTFAAYYEDTERFIMPLSHDEVVHGKGSLLARMPGDDWQRFANLRLLLAYQWLRPGKKLLFMGTELAPDGEWSHERSLDWHLGKDPRRQGVRALLVALGRLYRESSCLWRRDHEPGGFAWIDCSDRDQSVLSWERRDGEEHLVIVLNMTPVPRPEYAVGAPGASPYLEIFNTDAPDFGGSGWRTRGRHVPEPAPMHGRDRSLRLDLPPLSALVLAPERA